MQQCLEVSTSHCTQPAMDSQETHGQRQDPSSLALRDGEGELCAHYLFPQPPLLSWLLHWGSAVIRLVL